MVSHTAHNWTNSTLSPHWWHCRFHKRVWYGHGHGHDNLAVPDLLLFRLEQEGAEHWVSRSCHTNIWFVLKWLLSIIRELDLKRENQIIFVPLTRFCLWWIIITDTRNKLHPSARMRNWNSSSLLAVVAITREHF